MSPNNVPAHHRKQTQSTLHEFLGENNVPTFKEETQPETKSVKETQSVLPKYPWDQINN